MSAGTPSPYVLLSFDGLDLALRQSDVRILAPAADVGFGSERAGTIGHIDFAGESRPVYSLDRNLSPLDRVPQERRACALLGRGEHVWGLLCERVRILAEDSVQVKPLPACMCVPGSPVTGLAIQAGRIAVFTGAEDLGRFLGAGRQDGSRPEAA